MHALFETTGAGGGLGKGRRGLSTADAVHLSGKVKLKLSSFSFGYMVSAENKVGEPCDGKPSRTVRRALNSNERFTTTSLHARVARSIRRLVRLVIHF